MADFMVLPPHEPHMLLPKRKKLSSLRFYRSPSIECAACLGFVSCPFHLLHILSQKEMQNATYSSKSKVIATLWYSSKSMVISALWYSSKSKVICG